MRKAIAIVALLGLAPVTAFAMGGYGGGGGGGTGGFSGGNSVMMDQGRADAQSGLRLIEQKKYAEAIPYLQRALRVYQGNADILNYLGYASRMAGNFDDSLDYYQRALARNPDHKGAHEYLGELYLMLHQPDQARLQLAELTRLCPDGCVEKDTLTASIANYDAAAKAAPAAAPAAPAVAAPASNAAPASTAPQPPATPSQP